MNKGIFTTAFRATSLFFGLSLVVQGAELFDFTKDNGIGRIVLAGEKHDKKLAVNGTQEGGMVLDAKRGAILIPFEQVSLGSVGSSVEVSYKAVFLNVDGSSRAFRLGLLGLPDGQTIKEAMPALAHKVFVGAHGYFMNARLASKSRAESGFYRRNPEESLLFAASESSALGELTESLDVSNGNEYRGVYSVARTDTNEITVTHEFDGRMAQVAVDETGPHAIDLNLFTLFLSNASADETPSQIIFSELKISSKP